MKHDGRIDFPLATLRLIGLTLLVGVAGCASGEGAGEQRWSTRDQSVLGKVSDEPTLNVEPVADLPVGPEGQRTTATAVLQQALVSEFPLLRANAIEALQHAPPYLDDAVRLGLADESRGVRFVAAMTVGDQRLVHLANLLEPLQADESASVRAAAIYGLARCGRTVDINPLGTMLDSGDPEVKANAALVLGELGNRSALPMLRQARGRSLPRTSAAQARIVDLQIAEAMVKLGDEEELEGIRAALFVPPEQGELTALACLMCARLNDRVVINNLEDLATRTGDWQQSPEVRMAAATGLADLEPDRFPVEVPLQYIDHERSELRAQAALALGAGARRDTLPVLAARMNDPDPMVQVSAAAAVLKIVPE